MFTRIKQAMVSLIWGGLSQTVGTSVLNIKSEPSSGKTLSELEGDASVTKFGISENSSEFTLQEAFTIKLSTCESVLRVVLDETKLYESFYENKIITDMLGREKCFILDFVFNMGGSEALAETYFGAMKHQFKNNSAVETADLKTLIVFASQVSVIIALMLSTKSVEFIELEFYRTK